VPAELRPEPKLAESFEAAGFRLTQDVGIWSKRASVGDVTAEVNVDLLVPELLGGPGRRAARLGGHGERVARKARGLEAAVVDRTTMPIGSLEEADPRRFEISVAGPAALLVAKLHKLADRSGTERASDKDALDVLRLLRGISTEALAARLRALREDISAAGVTRQALEYLSDLFADRRRPGAQMAARATQPLEDPDTIASSCAVLAEDLLTAISRP
jgi:hypothetical protein